MISDNTPRGPIRWELLTTIGVVGAQLIGVAVWLGTEHANRISLEERVNRNEKIAAERFTRIEDDQRASLRDVAGGLEKINGKLEELRVLVAARLGK